MSNKKHILILEDNPRDFDEIKSAIVKDNSSSCFVYPESMDIVNKMLVPINKQDFDSISLDFEMFDIFIIDAHLINSGDSNGLKLAAYILNKNIKKHKIILISSTPKESNTLDDPRVKSFKKTGSVIKWSQKLSLLIAKVIEDIVNTEN